MCLPFKKLNSYFTRLYINSYRQCHLSSQLALKAVCQNDLMIEFIFISITEL